MDTLTLKEWIAMTARQFRGELWPNGLGFDVGSSEVCYSEARGQWSALVRSESADTPDLQGFGRTVNDAFAALAPVQE